VHSVQKSHNFPFSSQGSSISTRGIEKKTVQSGDATVDPVLPATRPNDCIISHSYYTLCYNEKNEQADWVAYKLTSGMLTIGAKRKDNFRTDPMVATGSASPADYAKSGYDKGHLCPAGDMGFSVDAMSETFFMSNMSPQLPQFNRGIWKALEEKVRDWAKANDELFITTGPVFTQISTSIGKNMVAVPQYYFKVVLDYKQPGLKGIGFIMKNQGSDKGIAGFAVTIDSVEKFTGIDFYTALPDAEEKMIEKQCNYKDW
jgi:endonuclease G, mitochondrial